MSNVVQAITPDEVVEEKAQHVPDVVIAAFNQLIAQTWNGASSNFMQDDVVQLIVSKGLQEGTPLLTRRDIFAKHYLDVEPIYRAAGWEVTYDKPGYNETYSANFTFRRGRRG